MFHEFKMNKDTQKIYLIENVNIKVENEIEEEIEPYEKSPVMKGSFHNGAVSHESQEILFKDEITLKEEVIDPNAYENDVLDDKPNNTGKSSTKQSKPKEAEVITVEIDPLDLGECSETASDEKNSDQGPWRYQRNLVISEENDESVYNRDNKPKSEGLSSFLCQSGKFETESSGDIIMEEGCVLNPENYLEYDPSRTANWMKQLGLLKQQMNCSSCKTEMNWTKRSTTNDGYAWKCQNKVCVKFKSTVSIRTGSFFSQSHVKLSKWLHVMYLWCEGESLQTSCNLTNLSPKTMVDIYNMLRKVCMVHFEKNPIKLGGPGIIVEVDESCFSNEVKHHKGRGPKEQIWVLGLVDTSYTPSIGYMEIVPARNAETLLPIINAVVQPGSIIYTDEWRAYKGLQKLDFTRGTVNHSVNFVNRETGVHTQTIESYWNKHKYHIKKMKGCKKELLSSYLWQMMWRDRFFRNPFFTLCDHIAQQF